MFGFLSGPLALKAAGHTCEWFCLLSFSSGKNVSQNMFRKTESSSTGYKSRQKRRDFQGLEKPQCSWDTTANAVGLKVRELGASSLKGEVGDVRNW